MENFSFPMFLHFLPKNISTGNFVMKVITRYSDERFMLMMGNGKIVDTIQAATMEAKKKIEVTGLLRKTNLFKNWYAIDTSGNQVRADSIDFKNMSALPIETIECHKEKFAMIQFKVKEVTNSKLNVTAPKVQNPKNGQSIPLVAEFSDSRQSISRAVELSDCEKNEEKRYKTKNTSVAASSDVVWDAKTLNDLLIYVDDPPELCGADQVSDTDANCTFKHPNGSLVNVELPISRILYVPAYKSIVSKFIVDTNW